MSRVTSTRARIKMRRILTETESGIKPAMRDAVNSLHKEIIRRLPRDTGQLEDLITAYVAKNGLRGEVGLRGKKAKQKGFYLRFIEFGTKGHTIKARPGSVISDGETVFGTEVTIPPQPAHPVLQPAWDHEKPKVRGAVGKVINDAIKKAQQL